VGRHQMINEYGLFAGILLEQIAATQSKQKEWKERILKEWEETKNLPRKKKKQRRKELRLDWSIATYDIFGMWEED
jgi:hypothetical protein